MEKTEIKERPIIMGAESVRAILEGRKTQTRRVINPRKYNIAGWDMPRTKEDMEAGYPFAENADGDFVSVVDWCPYGRIGDRLWVRETWKPGAWRNDGRVAIDYQASPELTHTPWICIEEQASKFIPRWLNEISKIGLTPNHEGRYEWEHGKSPFKWKRAMYMPRFASRITLEITDIRIERLQDITTEDVLAEGIISNKGYEARASEGNLFPCPRCKGYQVHEAFGYDYGITEVDCTYCDTQKKRYRIVWNSLNAKRGYPWESNPWVWVVSFKVVKNGQD